MKTPNRKISLSQIKPHVRRLRALMDVLGFRGHGEQQRFAEAVGLSPGRFSNIMRGRDLNAAVAIAVYHRFPGVSLEYLLLGDPGVGNPQLEAQLREWEARMGVRVFTR